VNDVFHNNFYQHDLFNPLDKKYIFVLQCIHVFFFHVLLILFFSLWIQVVGYCIRWIFGGILIWWINLFWVIGKFYIAERYCILHALSNKNKNLVAFNLADFCNFPNCQNKLYTKFSSYTVYSSVFIVWYNELCKQWCHTRKIFQSR